MRRPASLGPVLLVSALVCAPLALSAPTTSLDLGGTWLSLGLTAPDFPSPDAEGWTEVDVIAPVATRPWVCQRRSFEIPASLAGQRLFLRFEGVKYTATVRCNGQEVGRHMGGYEPFECEITRVAKVGAQNTVEVLAGSWHQLCADPEAVAELGLGRDGIEAARDQILYPIGSHSTMGIWAPVSLEARAEVYIEDVYIVPSFRKRTLTVETRVRNLSPQNARFSLRQQVLRDAKSLLALPERAGEVAAGDAAVLRCEAKWDDPPLWWPHDPVLLQFQCDLQREGGLADRKTESFGFRELWTDGPLFVLNGVPMHMLASATHPLGYTREIAERTYQYCREGNVNAFRLHAQPWGKAWYDVADETGMLIMHESAVWCFVNSYALGDERFWRNYADHVRAQIKLHRNRPSLYAWSLENEVLHCGGSRVPETEERLAQMAAVAREVDSSRLINYDGDEDPGGAADIINLHYPHEFPANRLYPNTCWWLDTPTAVTGWPRREWLWSRRKPLYIGEYLWEPSNTPDPYSLFHGDEAYTDLDGYREAAKAAAYRYQMEGYRAQGMSGGCPWNIFAPEPDNAMYRASTLAYRPQCAIIREWDTAFYPGQTVERSITFINDVLRPAKLKASCFCSLGGRESSRVEKLLEMAPAEIRHEPLRLTVPEAPERTAFDMVFTLEEGGREVFREVRPCWAVPAEPAPTADFSGLCVYDPDGGLTPILAKLGLPATAVKGLTDLPAAARCLVIGEKAFQAPGDAGETVIGAVDDGLEAVAALLNRGGRVVVLAQQYFAAWLPASLMDDGSTLAFLRRPIHPLVAGAEPGDFSLWGPDHLVSHRDIVRPERGPARVIVDAGGAGLDRVLLMEVPAGPGAYVFCQLPVVEKYGRTPLARRTLHRLLAYGVGLPSAAPRPLAVLAEDGKLPGLLKAFGVTVAEDGAAWADLAALLVQGDHPAALRQKDALARWVESGGLVWLHGPSAQYLEALGLAREAAVWTPEATAPVRAARNEGLVGGLRNEDLYWLSTLRPQDYANWALAPDITNHVLRPGLARATAIEIPADQLDNSQVAITRRTPEGILLATRGTITAPLSIPTARRYVIGILAGGTPMGGIYPAYSVSVDDTYVGGFMAGGREPALYTVSGELPAGEHELRVSFVNDASSPEEDRNALVAGAWVAPALPWPEQIVPLTDPAALYLVQRGKGAFLVDGVSWDNPGPNAARASRLVCTLLTNAGVEMSGAKRGTIVSMAGFTLDPEATHVRHEPAGGLYLGDSAWAEGPLVFAESGRYTIVLEARGTEAAGAFPEIEVSLDGTVVSAQELVSAGWQDLAFPLDVTAGRHIVRLRFTNDYYDPAAQMDRNLWIRRLAVAREAG